MKSLFVAVGLTIALIFAGYSVWIFAAPICIWSVLAATGSDLASI